MSQPTITGVRHVGLFAPDPERLAAFYQDVLGLQTVAQSKLNADGVLGSVFLRSESAQEPYQVALVANPQLSHTALEIASLADLRIFYRRVIGHGLPIRWALNHGVALAFYFADPAGNLIKLFWPTGVAYSQPHGHPIDLTQSEAALRQDVADLVAKRKGQ